MSLIGAASIAWQRLALVTVLGGVVLASSLGLLALPSGAAGRQPSLPLAPVDGGIDLRVGMDLAGPLAAGARARVTWRIRNGGESLAEAAVLTATWPSPLVLLAASPGAKAAPEGGLVWDFASLGPGEERLVTGTLQVPLGQAVPSALPLLVEARAPGELDRLDDNRLARDLLVRSSDLRLGLSTPSAPVGPGEWVTHSLLIHNVGQGRAEGLAIDVVWAAGLRGERAEGLPPGLVATWQDGRLSLRQREVPGPWTASVDLVARVPTTATAGMVLARPVEAVLSLESRNEDLGNDRAVATDLNVVQADLRLKVTGPSQALPDEVLEFALDLENRGTGPAHSLVLTASLPLGLQFLNALPVGRRVDERTWVWERSTLAPGDIDKLRLQTRLDGSRPAGSRPELRAEVVALGVDIDHTDNQAAASCLVLPGPAASLKVEAVPITVAVEGGRADVTVQVRDAFGNPVADGSRVDLGVSGGQASPAGGLTVAGSFSATFVAGPSPGAASVTARSGGAEGRADLQLAPASLSLGGSLQLAPGAAELQPGDHLVYRLHLHNGGLATARAPVVVATLEERVGLLGALVGNQAAEALDSVPPGIVDPPPAGYRHLAWVLPDLPLDGDVELQLDLEVEPDPGLPWTGFDTLFLRAAVQSPTADANPADQRHQQRIDVVAGDLYTGIELKSLSSSIRPGGLLVYQVTLGNAGQGTVSKGAVTVTLPAGTRFESWEPTHGTALQQRAETFAGQSSELVWDFETVLARTSGFLLRLSVDEDVAPERLLQTQVDIGADRYDTKPENNLSIDAGAWLSGVNLVVTAEGPATAAPGEGLTWRFQVRNQAVRDIATGVVVKALLPSGFELRSSEPEASLLPDGSLRWVVDGAMGPGAVAAFALSSSVPLDLAAGSRVALRLEASSPIRDSYAADNARSLGLTVVPGPAARLQLQLDRRDLQACDGDRVAILGRLSDAAGNPVADGSIVRWQSSAGLLEPAVAATAGGVVSVTLHAPREAGPIDLRAESGAAMAQETLHARAGRPARLSLDALPARVVLGARSLLRASLADACGNPAADGLAVDFLAERGRFLEGDGRSRPLAGGMATTTLEVGEQAGRLALEARHDGLVARAEIEVLESTPTPAPQPLLSIYLPKAAKAAR